MNFNHRIWRVIGRILLAVLCVHFVVELTGHHYIYNTLANTILKGKIGPEIQEYRDMPNRIVSAGIHQPWLEASNKAETSLTSNEEAYHDKYRSVSFLVAQRGELIFEKYWEHFDQAEVSNVFSMAKSVVSLLTGIAINRGEIKSLDTPVFHYLPQYETDLGRKMTIRHLLTMSSGIDFDENYLNPFAFPAKANYGTDLEGLLMNYEVTQEPGVYFEYKSGSTQVLAAVIEAATRTSLSNYLSEHVWKKVGASKDALWSLDREGGIEKAFCCINTNARDIARIGQVYLNHGAWNGKQIVDSTYVAISHERAGLRNTDGSMNDTYGFLWWIGKHKGYEFYFMRGIKGQYVMLVPDLDLVVVRFGRLRHQKEERPHPEDVYHYLNMALRMVSK